MNCKSCGKELREGAKFCNICGTAVECCAEQPAEFTESKKERVTVNKKLLVIFAIVLVIGIVAAFVIPMLLSAKQPSDTETIYVCVEMTIRTADGEVDQRTTYEYDDDGNLLSFNYSGNEMFDSYVNTWEYDDYGNLTQFTNNDIVLYSIDWEYDENDRITGCTYTTEATEDSAATRISYIFAYDDNGNLTSVLPVGDSVCGGAVFTYDKDGRLEEEIFYQETATYRHIFTYDDQKITIHRYEGNPVDTEDMDPKYSFTGTYEYIYNEDGQILKHATHRKEYNQTNSAWYEHTYGNNGFPNTETWYLADGLSVTALQLSCDEFGNIIKRKSENGNWIEYKYEEREVTAQQAAYFRRKEKMSGSINLHFFPTFYHEWYYHFVPNPLWEKAE